MIPGRELTFGAKRLLATLILVIGTATQAAPEPAGRLVQHEPHLCHDGRVSDGRPRDCAELLRWLDGDEHTDWGPPGGGTGRARPHPCSDGRFSDGRPRSCIELQRWLPQVGITPF